MLTRAGEYRYVSWLGFIEREEALSADARPVRLEAFAYALDEGFGADRIELKSGQHIQGCLVHGGVYGVVVGGVLRVV